jgi:hypothetical protein
MEEARLSAMPVNFKDERHRIYGGYFSVLERSLNKAFSRGLVLENDRLIAGDVM